MAAPTIARQQLPLATRPGTAPRARAAGIERWIVYPVVLWLIAFGSWLLATARPPRGTLWP
jgi:hypothetical protein